MRRVVMDEFHKMPYFGHLGYQKTISISRKQYFWSGMKNDTVYYKSRCMKCQQVKYAHQYQVGLLHPFLIPEWKRE